MAKAKKTEQEAKELTQDELLEQVLSEVEKEYGEGIMVDGHSIMADKKIKVPFSPSLDIITSGGIEEGSWVGITGNPKTGKTTGALCLAANAQKPEYGDRTVYYAKVEGRLSTVHLSGIQGLDLGPKKFQVIQSRKGKILTAQDFLRILINIVRTVDRAFIIIDSISALCNEDEQNSDIGDSQVGGNRLYSKFVRMMNQVVPVNNTIIVAISHLISNIGKPGYSERSARAQQYQYDYMLRTIGKEAWKAGEQQIGLKIKWACNTSKCGPPGMTMDSYLRFGTGIDRLFESLQFGAAANLIRRSGQWYYAEFLKLPQHKHLLESDEIPKFNGAEKLYQVLVNKPEWTAALEKEVLTMAGAFAGSDEE